jgi:hypothetical protein
MISLSNLYKTVYNVLIHKIVVHNSQLNIVRPQINEFSDIILGKVTICNNVKCISHKKQGLFVPLLQGYRNFKAFSVISSQMLLTGFPIEISVLSKF